MDEQPNRTDMIGELFGERERLAQQARTALAKGMVEALDRGRLAAGFIDDLVAFGRQDSGIGLEKIGVADGSLSIIRWERIP